MSAVVSNCCNELGQCLLDFTGKKINQVTLPYYEINFFAYLKNNFIGSSALVNYTDRILLIFLKFDLGISRDFAMYYEKKRGGGVMTDFFPQT